MRKRAAWIAVIAILTGQVRGAEAGLGEPETSVVGDVSAMHGKSTLKTEKPGYRMHEAQNPAQRVRQYVAKKSGMVFGLTWRGVGPPVEIERLTGKYYEEYAAAYRGLAEKKSKGSMRVRVQRLETEHLVIERGGHGRALSGRVYVKDLLPADTKLDEME